MNITIRESSFEDLKPYTNLLQKTYQEFYTNNEIGLTADCFSEEIFNTPDTQNYLLSNLENNDKQKSWLAFDENHLIGSITIVERDIDYELRGFYVSKEYQGQGIGKKLWHLALDFVKNKNITLDIYAHNTKTIEMYRRWGFEIDREKGEFYRHWLEWPENIKAKCIYMRYNVRK